MIQIEQANESNIVEKINQVKNMVGIIRPIDHLGRLCVPIEIRKAVGLESHAEVEFFAWDDGCILMRKVLNGER